MSSQGILSPRVRWRAALPIIASLAAISAVVGR